MKTGRICVWEGGSLWIGRTTGMTDPHAHHAVQISLAVEGSFQLRSPDEQTWTPYAAAFVPPHHPHAFSTRDALVGNIFVEPESGEGRALLERFGASGIVSLPEAVSDRAKSPLADALQPGYDGEPLTRAARASVRILTGDVAPRTIVDPRICRAIELVRDRLDRPVTQQEIAGAVFLSPGRFRHLFVQETGMAFRPYVLWLRVQQALERITAGESLTQAALAAGFADLAHLSRTFRRMFGLAPAVLERFDTYGPIVSRKP